MNAFVKVLGTAATSATGSAIVAALAHGPLLTVFLTLTCVLLGAFVIWVCAATVVFVTAAFSESTNSACVGCSRPGVRTGAPDKREHSAGRRDAVYWLAHARLCP